MECKNVADDWNAIGKVWEREIPEISCSDFNIFYSQPPTLSTCDSRFLSQNFQSLLIDYEMEVFAQ
jgi:hypothetical protein